MNSPFNLPSDAVDFLQKGRQLNYDPSECEPGKVGLHSLDSLTLGEIWGNTDDEADPNFRKEGYYAIPAVSLSASCGSYDPDYILLWLPNEKVFGSWDCDHWILTIFEKVSWLDIVKTPAPYIGAQWDSELKLGVRFQPWKHYKLKSGSPF
ncbi:MAG: hypothetical protein V4671_25455 [Armatimonadota bacterium]